MTTTSPTSLLDEIAAHEILSPEQIRKIRPQLDKVKGGRHLCRELVAKEWLTPYQANQLLKGNGSALRYGAYVALSRLGEGGMGQVFKARHVRLDRIVALKTIRQDKLSNPNAVKRFLREAQMASGLSHPNLVAIYDADQAEDGCFLVMEYIEGRDLSKLLRDQGPLPIDLACNYIRQTAVGLHYAHQNGLIHRDIKPHNLVVTHRHYKSQKQQDNSEAPGELKILDLGVARMDEGEGSDQTTLTQEGVVVGTIDYLSPEQARSSHTADARADLYSLGCTFYHLLAGRPPFEGSSPLDKLLKHQSEEATAIESIRPDVPKPLAEFIRRLMAKDPGHRCQTAAEVAQWLTTFSAKDSATLPCPPPPPVAKVVAPTVQAEEAMAVPTVVEEKPKQLVPWRRRKKWWAIGAGVVLFLLLAIAGDDQALFRTAGFKKLIPGNPAPGLSEDELALRTWPRSTGAVLRVDVQKLISHKWVQDHFEEELKGLFQSTRPVQQRLKGMETEPSEVIEEVVATVPLGRNGTEQWVLKGRFDPLEMLAVSGGPVGKGAIATLPIRDADQSLYAMPMGHRTLGLSRSRESLEESFRLRRRNPLQRPDRLLELLLNEPWESCARFAILGEMLKYMTDPKSEQEIRPLLRLVSTVSGSLVLSETMILRMVVDCKSPQAIPPVIKWLDQYLLLLQRSGPLLAKWNKDLVPLVVLAQRVKRQVNGSTITMTVAISPEEWDRETQRMHR